MGEESETCDWDACRCYREESHDGTPDGCLTDGRLGVTGRRHVDQPDEESRDDPNEKGACQDDWQSDEDISALDGKATDGAERPGKA